MVQISDCSTIPARDLEGQVIVSNEDQTSCQRFLLNTDQKTVALKNFNDEVRGLLDVTHLLERLVILMDEYETEFEAIIRKLIENMTFERPIAYSKIQREIFSFANSSEFLVPNIRLKLQCVDVLPENIVQDQSWVTVYASIDGIEHRHLGIARLGLPTNFGESLGDVQFIILVIAPLNQKDTKSALETAKTFSTLFCDHELRTRLLDVNLESDFKHAISTTAKKLSKEEIFCHEHHSDEEKLEKLGPWYPGRGIFNDFYRRWVYYVSDFTDGVKDARSISKTISAAVFLYFSIVPTVIAFAMLNMDNTKGLINVRKQILGQWIAGLYFGIVGGQLFLIMLSTAPFSIYIEVIYDISESSGYDFFKMYTCTGIWCAIFLLLAAATEASNIMKFARRSVEEIFGLFISCALIFKAILATILNFKRYDPHCSDLPVDKQDPLSCERSVGLLFFGLMCGTFWLSWNLYNFRKTPYLSKTKRELLVDYAAPIAVIIMSFIGSYCFRDIPKESFAIDYSSSVLTFVAFWNQPIVAHLICMGLGLPLAILFFMDQLLVTNTVDNKQNNLKKGAAKNWDLMVVAFLNVFFSLTGLPWTLGALPQSLLHLKAQANIEDRLVDGAMQHVVVKNRESRLATLIAHILMVPTYFFLLPYLQLIPTSVFHGLFLCLAVSGMIGNEMCERILLIFTEQRSYPPLHYIRRVPQKTVHLFTFIEVIQLAILFYIGFVGWPVLEMTFPVVIFLFIPFRSLILPLFFSHKHLEALDGVH